MSATLAVAGAIPPPHRFWREACVRVARWFATEAGNGPDEHVLADAGLGDPASRAHHARIRRARLGASGLEMRGLPF